MRQKIHNSPIRILLAGIALAGVFLVVLFLFRQFGWKERNVNLQPFEAEQYQAVFLSMYPISTYDVSDFSYFWGISTLKSDTCIPNLKTLSLYLETIFSSGNAVDHVFLGLDPGTLWTKARGREEKWQANLEKYLFPWLDAHPGVIFELLLPAPSMDYWLELSEEEVDAILAAYASLGRQFGRWSNARVYFLGAEEWLIANPANYIGTLETNAEISHKIVPLTFCDGVYLTQEETLGEKLAWLRDLIAEEKAAPTVYPDLSDWYVVYFGDSILAYDHSTASIPGVVSGLSGADYANCGEGGTPAAENSAGIFSLMRMLTCFQNADLTVLPENSDYGNGLKTYLADEQAGKLNDKQLCFVLNFGLNDYFCGHPVRRPDDPDDLSTYEGALRVGIRYLKEHYPEAVILVLAPTFTSEFSNGTELLSQEGGCLTEYVDAALRAAEDFDVPCLNFYQDSGINAENWWRYLADGCHPNETGRFLLGKQIVNFLGEYIQHTS